ncbi:MAG: type II toxin-antitoxin system Phd/YefM family antitoxin, partial [Vicinamibacteria bacterium]
MGVRELRDHLSNYLRRVREGELLMITDRGEPVGELGPAKSRKSVELAFRLVRRGMARWSGGKPRGLLRAPRSKGGLVSAAVIQD